MLALNDADRRLDQSSGLVCGLLIALPLWMGIGAALLASAGNAPINEATSLALMVAAVSESILLRYVWRSQLAPARGRFSGFLRLISLRKSGSMMHPLLRQTMTLGALTIAYLHYYFWDVSLQIASLNSVTVFVPVTSLAKAAA